MAKKLFISYSHKDKEHLPALIAHLKPLERAGLIEPWFDGYIIPGDDIDEKVATALEQADIVVLLVSSDFLNSEYCYSTEMRTAMERHESGEARVVPVMLRECIIDLAPFSRLSMLPTDAKPIMSLHWVDKDEAWKIVAQGIRTAASQKPNNHGTQATNTAHSSTVQLSPPEANGTTPKPMTIKSKRIFSDKDHDDFRHAAFAVIADRFEASINALSDGFSGTFRRIDANRFISSIYLNGNKEAGITVWMGGRSFGRNSINYHQSDSGEVDTMNGSLEIKTEDGNLVLSETMSMYTSDSDTSMNPDQAAEYLWDQFVEQVT